MRPMSGNPSVGNNEHLIEDDDRVKEESLVKKDPNLPSSSNYEPLNHNNIESPKSPEDENIP